MSQSFDVCIRGAGLVGRTLALLLAQARLRVGLVQNAASQQETGGDVRAYALNAASRAVLESVRCWPTGVAGTAVTPVQRMRVFGDAGGEVNFAPPLGSDALTWIVDVPTLEATLASAIQFAPNVTVLDVPVSAALTVICEGKNSVTRQEFGVDFDTEPYGQTAIAARVRCAKAHEQQAFQWFRSGEVLGLLPLGEDGFEAALVWSVDDARVQQLLALPEAEFSAQLQAVCVVAGEPVAGEPILGEMALTSARLSWPLLTATAQRWTGNHLGRSWALAGDAAHTVHPLAGQGLNLGLADAAELARVLGQRAPQDYWRGVGDAKLLRRYERARRAALAPVGAVTDGLQRLFAHHAGGVQQLRNLGMQGFERASPLKNWVARQAMGQ